jgi:hypothetical protein
VPWLPRMDTVSLSPLGSTLTRLVGWAGPLSRLRAVCDRLSHGKCVSVGASPRVVRLVPLTACVFCLSSRACGPWFVGAAQALVDLETSSKDLAADLKDVSISAVKEFEISANKKALVIYVPFRQHKRFQKISARLVRELEKKFAGKHVFIMANRTILSQAVRA